MTYQLTYTEAQIKYSGIDLHANTAVVAVIDDEEKVLYCKRLINDFATVESMTLSRLKRLSHLSGLHSQQLSWS
ncbi:MAG: hypothetical protein CBARDCOR_6614 [uncultured Caballeronia sp.]|nr:MAG: hypothetical protein CBARDCOR_6614 [uncultured Caballeronia sp.]